MTGGQKGYGKTKYYINRMMGLENIENMSAEDGMRKVKDGEVKILGLRSGSSGNTKNLEICNGRLNGGED